MALVATVGLDHFDQDEPLVGITRLSTAGLDYFDQDEPLVVIGSAASGGVTVDAALLTLTATLHAPAVSTTRNVTATPSLLTLTSTLQAPTVSTTRSVTATPALLSLALTLSEPTVSVPSGADGLDYFHLGEPVGVKAAPVTRAFDYFHAGEPLSAVTKQSALAGGAVFVTPSLLSLALTLSAPSVTTTRSVTIAPPLLTLTTTLHATTVTPRRNVAITPARFDLALTLHTPTLVILQVARPIADLSIGGWSTNTGSVTNLWDAINEGSPNDSDYIRSPVSPATPAEYKVRLSPLVDPQTSAGHVIPFHYGKDEAGGDRIDLLVRLYRADGTTLITQVGYADIPVAPVAGTIELSGPNADDIPSEDYAVGLVLGLSAVVGSGGGSFGPPFF